MIDRTAPLRLRRAAMTDEELFRWLGFNRDGTDIAKAHAYISALSHEKRELFERMRALELWANGFGPKPDFPVLCDYD